MVKVLFFALVFFCINFSSYSSEQPEIPNSQSEEAFNFKPDCTRLLEIKKISFQQMFPNVGFRNPNFVKESRFRSFYLKIESESQKIVSSEYLWTAAGVHEVERQWSAFLRAIESRGYRVACLKNISIWGLSLPFLGLLPRVDWGHIQLVGARGEGVKFFDSRWNGVTIFQSNLPGISLDGHFDNGVFAQTDLRDTNKFISDEDRKFPRFRNLTTFTNYKMLGVDLSGSQLESSIWENVVLKNVNLSGANLRSAELDHVKFQEAITVEKADFRQARFQYGTDLSGWVIDSHKDRRPDLEGATYDDSVTLPKKILGYDSEQSIDAILQIEFKMQYVGTNPNRQHQNKPIGFLKPLLEQALEDFRKREKEEGY